MAPILKNGDYGAVSKYLDRIRKRLSSIILAENNWIKVKALAELLLKKKTVTYEEAFEVYQALLSNNFRFVWSSLIIR
jgi:hypothetical protein